MECNYSLPVGWILICVATCVSWALWSIVQLTLKAPLTGAESSPAKRTRPIPSISRTSAVASTAADVLTAEPALLATIISFIPANATQSRAGEEEGDGRPNEDDNDNQDPPASERAEVVLQAIASLCRAIPGLGKLVGPSNEMFWREMVLAHFDFSHDDEVFNVDDACELREKTLESLGYIRQEDVGDYYSTEEWDEWCKHPVKPFIDAWKEAHPGDDDPEWILSEDLANWQSIGAYFRPSQFQFLRQNQETSISEAIGPWPANEDAFSLFCDLMLVQRMSELNDQEFTTWSDGEQFVYPCLLGQLDGEIDSDGYALLEHCGFNPHYWAGNPAVSPRWSGFDGPLPEDPKLEKNTRTDEVCSDEEYTVFPHAYLARDFFALRRFVYESFSDWRRLHVNFEEEQSPEFYIGKSKRSGRWIGFLGQSDYCGGRDTQTIALLVVL